MKIRFTLLFFLVVAYGCPEGGGPAVVLTKTPSSPVRAEIRVGDVGEVLSRARAHASFFDTYRAGYLAQRFRYPRGFESLDNPGYRSEDAEVAIDAGEVRDFKAEPGLECLKIFEEKAAGKYFQNLFDLLVDVPDPSPNSLSAATPRGHRSVRFDGTNYLLAFGRDSFEYTSEQPFQRLDDMLLAEEYFSDDGRNFILECATGEYVERYECEKLSVRRAGDGLLVAEVWVSLKFGGAVVKKTKYRSSGELMRRWVMRDFRKYGRAWLPGNVLITDYRLSGGRLYFDRLLAMTIYSFAGAGDFRPNPEIFRIDPERFPPPPSGFALHRGESPILAEVFYENRR